MARVIKYRSRRAQQLAQVVTIPPPAEELPTMLAFDYRLEGMDSAAIIAAGYLDAVVSWRQNDTANARAHLTALRAAGVRLWVTIEPWVRTDADDANVKSGWASDDALWDLAEAGNYWLRDNLSAITNPVPEFWDDFQNRTRGLDFSNTTFAHAWADWIHTRWPDIEGVYHDYGFPHDGGLSWVNGYGGVTGATWATWAPGYRAAFDREHTQYGNRALLIGEYGSASSLNAYIAPRASGVIIEGAGPLQGNLFTYKKAWLIAREGRAAGLRPVIWYLDTNAQARRLLACMTVATRGYFARRVDVRGMLTTPELQTLSIGTVPNAATQLVTDVWLAEGTRGYVVVNVSAGSYSYGGRTVASNDGLMVQTHDVSGDELLPHRTNVGV